MKQLITTIILTFSLNICFAQNTGNGISKSVLKEIKKSVKNNSETRALINAVSANNIQKLSLNRANYGKTSHYFTHRVKTKGITNQKSSGRCWLFTGLNTLRPKVIDKLNIKNFEFSQSYSFFFDQLEKSNLFLEAIISTGKKEKEDKTVDWLFKNPISDGGQWTTFADIVDKYGLVPKSAMPETYHSENTKLLSRLLRRKLREDGMNLRELIKKKKNSKTIQKVKIEMLSDIYRILVLTLGNPPTKFTWQYELKPGIYSEYKSYTPKEFYSEMVGINLNNYVMLMNDPSRDYNKLYEIEYDRSLIEGFNWKYINLTADKIKSFAEASILDNEAMYFSCDVGKQLNREYGTLDLANYSYGDLLGVEFGMDKNQRIQTYESGSSHGMSLMGFNYGEDGTIDKWLLENSWGSTSGHKGFLTMTDEWFDEYMFRLITHKKYIDDKTLKILENEAIMLPPWDPMFAPEQ
jgi:bleomycin hydrolase